MNPAARLLNTVERIGNRLPDPVFLFLWLVGGLILLSMIGAALGWSAVNPVTGDRLAAQSLLSPENLERLIIGMPRTLADFPPLGIVVTIIYGASVAERAGLFATAIRGALLNAPRAILTPIVVVTGMVSHHASDASYVVVIPLAAVIFAAAGRHPLAGLAAGFAAVSGGYAGNLFPGASDALILGITEPAAHLIDPSYSVNIAGNWFFIIGVVLVFTPIVWFLTDRVIEPRLGAWAPSAYAAAPAVPEKQPLTADEKRGLAWAGLALMGMIALNLVHCLIAWAGMETMWSFIVLQAATMFCFALTGSNFGAISMEPFARGAGLASSFQAGLTTLISAGLGAVVGSHFDGTTLPLAMGFFGYGCIALIVVLWAEKGRLFTRPRRATLRAGAVQPLR